MRPGSVDDGWSCERKAGLEEGGEARVKRLTVDDDSSGAGQPAGAGAGARKDVVEGCGFAGFRAVALGQEQRGAGLLVQGGVARGMW